MERIEFTFGKMENRNIFSRYGEIEFHHRNHILKNFDGFDNFYYWGEEIPGVITIHDSQYKIIMNFIKAENEYTDIYLSSNPAGLYFIYKNNKVKANVKLLVSSHHKYLDKTGIKDELDALNFPNEDIAYVLSGCDNEDVNNNFYNASTNHWEYSALLRAGKIPQEEAPEYWFMIHDTCIPSYKFHEKIMGYDFSIPFDIVMLNRLGHFNIGFYKHSFLASQEIQDFLYNSRNITKAEGILYELNNEMRKHAKLVSCLSDSGLDIRTHRKIAVWSRLPRTEAYSKDIDLYKYFYSESGHPNQA